MEKYFKIGVITASHGVHGEMKVYPTTDDSRRFKKCKQVFVEQGKSNEKVLMDVESVRLAGDFVLLKVKGIDAPEAIIPYRQKGIFVDREHAVALAKNEYFIADLIGLRVLDDQDKEIGELEEVLPTGANDVYQIRLLDGRELLLPAIKDCILAVNIEEGWIRVHILDGLMDEK